MTTVIIPSSSTPTPPSTSRPQQPQQHARENFSYPPHVATILKHCPRYPITYATTWYILPSSPDCLICNLCFTTHLSPTPFASSFAPVILPRGQPRTCSLPTPRFFSLLSIARITANLKPIEGFIVRSGQTAKCPGRKVEVGSEVGVRWHQLSPEGLVACEGCYQSWVLPSRARAELDVLYPSHWDVVPFTEVGGISCDVASWRVKKATEVCRRWTGEGGLKGEMERAVAVGKCVMLGKKVEVSLGEGDRWFRMKEGVLGGKMVVCEECFGELVGNEMRGAWEELLPGSHKVAGQTRKMLLQSFMVGAVSGALGTDISPLIDEEDKPGKVKLACMMGVPAIRGCYSVAEEAKDLTGFVQRVQVVMQSPACTPEGINDRSCAWYGVPSVPGSQFAVCGGCFAGILSGIKEMNVAFVKIPPPTKPGEAKVCDFAMTPKFTRWFAQLSEAVDKQQPAIFSEYVKKMVMVPTCPRSSPVDDAARKWWGMDDFSVCEECALQVVVESSLGPFMKYKGIGFPCKGKKCDLYSPRTRGMWTEACANADKMRGLGTFIGKMREREVMYQQTYVPLQRGLQAVRQNAQNTINKMELGTKLQGLDMAMGVNTNFNGGPTYRIGNHTEGWWSSSLGLEGFRMVKDSLGQQVMTPEMKMQLNMLQDKWREWE